MKKLFGILAIGLMLMASGTKQADAQAQIGITPLHLVGSPSGPWTTPEYPGDTVVKSTTYFWDAPVSSFLWNSDVAYTFSVDSISGTPNMAVTTWASNDDIHWTAVASAATFNSAKNYWYTSSTVPGKSDSCISVNTNPWTARWIGFKVVVNSNTQRARYHIKVQAVRTY